eukprot:467789_1
MGNSKSKTKQSMSAAQLLVNGYIRQQIEPLLNNLIIPDAILLLCWMFYDFNHRKLIFCLNWGSNNPNPLYFTYSGSTGGSWHAKFWSQGWKINNNMGICSTTGLKRYPKVFSKYNDIWANITIFVCGHGLTTKGQGYQEGYSYTHQCYCGIFVDTNILANAENEKKFTSDRWELPHIPLYKLSKNTLSFSSRYQLLFSIGGEHWLHKREVSNVSKLYCLNFTEDINNIATWEWKSLNSKIGDRRSASSVIIEKYDKLFICGGENKLQKCMKTMLIYDIKNNRIKHGSNFEFGAANCGIVNNQYKTDEIYLGGGTHQVDDMYTNRGKTMQCYNAVKNKWNILPNMKLEYTCNPVLWLEDGYKLYIATCENNTNGCEVLDLRVCKKWNIVYAKDTLLKDFFGMSNNTKSSRCRLVTS